MEVGNVVLPLAGGVDKGEAAREAGVGVGDTGAEVVVHGSCRVGEEKGRTRDERRLLFFLEVER